MAHLLFALFSSCLARATTRVSLGSRALSSLSAHVSRVTFDGWLTSPPHARPRGSAHVLHVPLVLSSRGLAHERHITPSAVRAREGRLTCSTCPSLELPRVGSRAPHARPLELSRAGSRAPRRAGSLGSSRGPAHVLHVPPFAGSRGLAHELHVRPTASSALLGRLTCSTWPPLKPPRGLAHVLHDGPTAPRALAHVLHVVGSRLT